jgi:ubiquinone/menaquinone biosynthesis C-methylase UbiE
MKNKLISFISSFAFVFTASCLSPTEANDTTIYHSQDDKSNEQAVGYSKTNQSLSRYLAYRDIPSFIAQYCHGKKSLDYGAGTGFSTQFLQKQALEVTGVDISKEMLTQAILNCPDTSFYLIQNGSIPSMPETYDLVFSSLVLFELGSEKEILTYLEEAKRVLKKDGVFIAVTGSQEMYSKDWLIFNTDFPENKNLKSGDLARIYLCDADIEFTDYYWTEADYRRLFNQAGFQLLEVHYPMGKASEPYSWKDEKTSSPFVVLVAEKKP